MNSLKNLIATILLFIAAVPTIAKATPTTTTTFAFSGQCDDCAGTLLGSGPFNQTCDNIFQSVTGALVLQNFQPGVPLTTSNFSSLTYNGSSILLPFTLTSGPNITLFRRALDASGTVLAEIDLEWVQPPPGLTTTLPDFFLCNAGVSGGCSFFVTTTNFWSLASPSGDLGRNGFFSVAAVPEPASLVLLGTALVGFGVMRSRRKRAS
jgi:hypothetical protein